MNIKKQIEELEKKEDPYAFELVKLKVLKEMDSGLEKLKSLQVKNKDMYSDYVEHGDGNFWVNVEDIDRIFYSEGK